jgi:hypothetical protein
MISVICTQCRARLEMDDAFAGGVCRCQYCGTIQTVPSLSKIKRQMAPTQPGPAAGAPSVAPSPRPQASGAPAAEPNGLDALAEAVASSSGLGRGSLRAGGQAAPPGGPGTPADPAAASPESGPAVTPKGIDYARPAQQKRRPPWMILTGAAIAALLLVALGGALFSVRTGPSTATTVSPPVPPGPGPATNGSRGDPGEGGEGDTPAIPAAPHFCGISLQGEASVVYVLDRGSATAEMFDTLKEATYRSLESLKPNQKFAVIFWNNGGDEACYPEGSLADVRQGEIAAAKSKFADVYAGGRADPHEAIKEAAALKPSAIVLVTGKAFELDEDLIDRTREALGGSRTKVHTVALGSDDNTTVLKRISESTGGQSRVVTKRELRAFSE